MTAIALSSLAIWRVTHLLWGEDGPADVFVRLRRLAGTGFFGGLLDCFYCLSLWVALPFALMLGATWPERAVLWFAFSGGAILLERATATTPAAPPASWHERAAEHPQEGDTTDGMLR